MKMKRTLQVWKISYNNNDDDDDDFITVFPTCKRLFIFGHQTLFAYQIDLMHDDVARPKAACEL